MQRWKMESSNTVTFKLTEGEKHSVTMKLQGWGKINEFLVASSASTVVSWGNPHVSLCYTIKPNKPYNLTTLDPARNPTVYGFYAEALQWPSNTAVSLKITGVGKGKIYRNILNHEGLKGGQILLLEDSFPTKPTPAKTDPNSEIQNDLLVTIESVIFRQCTESDTNQGLEAGGASSLEAETDGDNAASSLTDDIAAMYAYSENLADIILDMKDNMALSGHRFILSARSPLLKKKIAELTGGFSTTQSIKLDIFAKPMIVVLHWMYTEKLHENVGKFWDQVLDAAKKLEMEDLATTLENNVMAYVTSDNMMEMYQITKRNGIEKARKQISEFIKENLED